MANEISASASLSITKNGTTASGSGSLVATLAGNAFSTKVVTLASTTKEALVIDADLTLGGYMLIKNLDDTSVITISLTSSAADATNTVAALLPGEFCLFKPASGSTVSATPTAGGDIAVVLTEL